MRQEHFYKAESTLVQSQVSSPTSDKTPAIFKIFVFEGSPSVLPAALILKS